MATRKKAPAAAGAGKWASRLVGEEDVAPDQLLANPLNPRIHPASQQAAMRQALDQIGWVQRVVVNRRTGHVIDGHLRVEIALSEGEPTVPVVYVDLSPEEEKVALATFDAISSMAVVDEEMMAALLNEITAQSPELADFMQEIADVTHVDLDPDPPAPKEPTLRAQWNVLVVLDTEEAQVNLLEELQREGYECRALIS